LLFTYLGPVGTFSEEAAWAYLKRNNLLQKYQMVSAESVPDVLMKVDKGICDVGIVPIENSQEGSVVIALDMLVHQVDLNIIGEEILPVHHHLMTYKGIRLEDIDTVLSHPQALGQCRQNLHKLLPSVRTQVCNSTAEAAEMVVAYKKGFAAIGTKRASSVYGLEILYENLEDNLENTTRFIIVGKDETAPSGNDKTSIVFAFTSPDKPGNLYKALAEFALRDINLTKLESRPFKKSLGEYLFFVDMLGHKQEKRINEALEAIQELSSFYKLLGSYPLVYNNGHQVF
jgi:prephenate dehydratase